MLKRTITASLAVLVLVAGQASAETEAELKKEMQDLHVKQEAIRKEYADGVKALNDSTVKELSGVQKGDKGAHIRIMRERKARKQELREKFKKDAESLRAESDAVKSKIKAFTAAGKGQAKAALPKTVK